MAFTLKDDGYPFKKIMRGKDWVGRVLKHATEPYYLGIIGKITVKRPTELEAFAAVVAQFLGFASETHMRSYHHEMLAENRRRKRAAKFIASEMLAGNFKPFEEAVDRMLAEERKRTALEGQFDG